MSESQTEPRVCCPSCSFSLTQEAQRDCVCDNCGTALDAEYLRCRREELITKDAHDRRVLACERTAAVVGAIMLASGAAMVAKYAPLMMVSGRASGVFLIGTLIAVGWRWHNRDPMWPVLAPLGLFWFLFGLFCAAC